MDNNELNKLIDEELKKLTLKDKLSLLYGETAFTTNSKIKNIDVIKMSDGPNGLRTQKFDEKAIVFLQLDTSSLEMFKIKEAEYVVENTEETQPLSETLIQEKTNKKQ